MKEELNQYRVEDPGSFWQGLPILGVSGYDAIEFAQKRHWRVLSSWGRDGWDLGSWPLVIVFWRSSQDAATGASRYDVIEYIEGDVALWSCPTEELRVQVTDELAFWHWKFHEETWVAGYESVDDLPPKLRGPFSWERLERERQEEKEGNAA